MLERLLNKVDKRVAIGRVVEIPEGARYYKLSQLPPAIAFYGDAEKGDEKTHIPSGSTGVTFKRNGDSGIEVVFGKYTTLVNNKPEGYTPGCSNCAPNCTPPGTGSCCGKYNR